MTDRSIRDERSTQHEELVHTGSMDRPTAPAGSAARRPTAPVTSHSTRRLATRLRPWTPWISNVARLGLAVVWAWAARAKILDPNGAVLSVRAYRLLPEALVHPVAWGLPFLELAVAVLLAAGVAIRLAAAISTGLLLVFIAGIASAWARGLQIDCGCFSTGGAAAHVGASQYLGELLRDAGLAVVSIALVWRPWSRLALGGEADRRAEPPQPDPRDRLEDG
jgi:uncharacterized membrane protein YphA (DoxX/SURF4 family)